MHKSNVLVFIVRDKKAHDKAVWHVYLLYDHFQSEACCVMAVDICFIIIIFFFLEFAEIFWSFVMFLGMSDCMTFAPGSKRAVLRQWISAFSY